MNVATVVVLILQVVQTQLHVTMIQQQVVTMVHVYKTMSVATVAVQKLQVVRTLLHVTTILQQDVTMVHV